MKPFVLLLLLAAACAAPDEAPPPPAAVDSARVTVDSALPVAERLERFRATIADRPDTLRGASPSLDALAQRWVLAVQRRDTAALNAMVLDRAEFAWLFYPTNKLARPPYEMPPALLWEDILANSDAGARRVLDRFGGRAIELRSVRCPGQGEREGINVLRPGCMVRLRAGADTVPAGQFFGTILERDGRFKFVGLANRL